MSTAPSSPSATPARTATRRRPAVAAPGVAPAAAALRLAAGLWLAAGLLLPPADAAVVEEIVAKVNNRIITASEFEERQKALQAQVQQETRGTATDQELRQARDVLLANIITEALLLERAATVFDMDRIRNSLIEDFRKQQGINTDADLEQALKDQQMTRKELEDHLIRLAVPNEIINYDVKRKISVSETEMKDYYAKNHSTWESPESATLREIVVLYEPPTRDEALERARAVVAEARGGADFLELVKQHSEAGTKETQGLIGPIPIRDLNAALATAARTLEPGQVSEPIDTGRSFHVLRLEGRAPASVRALEEVRDEVRNAVREQKFKPRFDVYLRRLWKENHIEVSPKYESWLVVSPLKPRAGAETASVP
jgi:peptidyl-prolyl cis-trans isomerase SurA